LTTAPSAARTALTALRQFRGTCTLMPSAIVVPSHVAGSFPCLNAYSIGATPAACTPKIRGTRSITPSACISARPFAIPPTVQPSPTLTATQSGSRPASTDCSAISSPHVFFPSTSTGLIAQLRLYQPNLSHAAEQSRYASSYGPATENTFAP